VPRRFFYQWDDSWWSEPSASIERSVDSFDNSVFVVLPVVGEVEPVAAGTGFLPEMIVSMAHITISGQRW
jgi:hypothetical protein